MPEGLHETSLIALLAIGFAMALLFGLLASTLRISPIVGYLIAGIAVGPFTPGFVADSGLATQLAEIGVILLMFGVGLHFSLRDLMNVRAIALPGAIAQILTATAIGAGMAYLMGWSFGAGLVFGLSLSVASTVVLLRALEDRKAFGSSEGKIAVGWLIVEDLAMVLALVLLPAIAQGLGGDSGDFVARNLAPQNIWLALAITLAKVAVFVVLALVVGTRLVPWLLARVARTGSRELFTLSVLAIALGIAYGSAAAFGVSFALGAFFAGVILNETDLSHQAGNDSLPLKDAFAVLFFVSVGMLFDPTIVVREPLAVLGVLAIIMVGKSLAAFVIVLIFRYPVRTALTVSASLAQIGEFSFVLAGLGTALGLLPAAGRDLILAGALLSIALNPITFAGISPIMRWMEKHPRLLELLERRGAARRPSVSAAAALNEHAILIGFGRVGGAIGPVLASQGLPLAVIERDHHLLQAAQARGIPTVEGDATADGVLEAAGLARARLLVVATPDGFQARRIIEIARAIHPAVDIVVRTHSDAELDHLRSLGVGSAVMGEHELAHSMLEYALRSLGVPRERARSLAGRDPQVNPEGT